MGLWLWFEVARGRWRPQIFGFVEFGEELLEFDLFELLQDEASGILAGFLSFLGLRVIDHAGISLDDLCRSLERSSLLTLIAGLVPRVAEVNLIAFIYVVKVFVESVGAGFGEDRQLGLLEFQEGLVHLCREDASFTRQLRIAADVGLVGLDEHAVLSLLEDLRGESGHRRGLSKPVVSILSGRAPRGLDLLNLDLAHGFVEFADTRVISQLEGAVGTVAPQKVILLLFVLVIRSDHEEVELHLP